MASHPTILTECPGSQEGLHFATHWYRLPQINSFRVCTHCFQSRIASSRFAGSFEQFWHTPVPGEQVVCNFNTGKAHQLFDYAQQTGDLEPLYTYAARRISLLSCPAKQGTTGGRGLRWFGIREIPDFMACEACFEEHVSATSFGQQFTPYPRQHGPNDIWACDVAITFIKRCLEQYSAVQDWSSFVNACRYRLSLPQCDPEPSATKTWYTPARVPQATICETCFFDEMMLLPNNVADNFTELPRWNQNTNTTCAMNKISVQIATNKLLDKDFDRWQHTIYRIMSMPACGTPVNDAEFYTIMNPRAYAATDFGLCEACYVGCIEPANLSHLFRKNRFPGQAVCEFSPLNSRFIRSFKKLTQAMMTNDATNLTDYAIRAKQIVPCTRNQESPENVYWWGTDDFVFCAECYDEFGKDSVLATAFTHQGTFDARPEARCDMWSDEVRREYLAACTRGDMTGFTSYIKQWQAQQTLQPGIPQITYASPPDEVTRGLFSNAEKPKKSKLGKFCKVLGAGAGIALAAAPLLLASNSDGWGDDYSSYSYDSGYSSYDDSSYTDNSYSDGGYETGGGHSMMSIFNEAQAGIEQNYQNNVAAAQAQQSAPASAGSNVAALSAQSYAQHQMNMGMMQMTASSFGMHNAAMSGINNYGSSYNNAYDSTYQSYSGGYNAGMNNMVSGMAMSSYLKR